MANAAVTWRSCRQDNISLSTAVAELIALTEGTKEGLWILDILDHLGFKLKKFLAYCDNTATIVIAKNPQNHSSTKHVEIKALYCREIYEKGKLEIKYCKSKDMIADIFTKALPRSQFEKLRQLMGLHDLSKQHK